MPPAGQVLPCEDYSVEKPTVIEKFNAVINSPQFIFSALWFIWLTTGTIFYSYDLDIGWAKGFYMAVNVGYSIGWGDIFEQGHPTSQWFSLFFVLCGSSFVAAALGFFAQSIVNDRDNWYTNELQRIAYLKYNEENKNNIFLVWGSWASYNGEKVRAVVLWFLVVTIATTVALICSNGGWSFIEALYFAVSTLSTGGLYALPDDSPAWSYGLTGMYAAFGIPLMAIAMATLASFFITTGDIAGTVEQIREPVTQEELDMLTDFEIANDDGIVDKSEFIILCMVRTGAATPQLIKMIVEYYNELDVDKDGSLEASEIIGMSAHLKRQKGLTNLSMPKTVQKPKDDKVITMIEEFSADDYNISSSRRKKTPLSMV